MALNIVGLTLYKSYLLSKYFFTIILPLKYNYSLTIVRYFLRSSLEISDFYIKYRDLVLKNKSVRVLTHCSIVFLMVAFWRGQSTCCKLNLSFRRRPEILPDNKGLSWFPVFLNGSQLCFSFFFPVRMLSHHEAVQWKQHDREI